jgi:hypothetical protein
MEHQSSPIYTVRGALLPFQKLSPGSERTPRVKPSASLSALGVKIIALSQTQPRSHICLLSYHNDCVIISRAYIPPKRGRRMHRAACATETYVPPSRPLTHNPIKPQNRSASYHPSFVTHDCHFLIASHEILEIHLTPSQQTRKRFLIASFSAAFAQASHPASPNSLIVPFLTATHPDSGISQTHESKREKIF